MKTIRPFVKTLMAIAVMLVCASPAHAQLGKIVKSGSKVVTGTGEYMANKAKEKAEEKARKKVYEMVKKRVLNGKEMPEQPWPMTEAAVKEYSYPPAEANPMSITWYLYNLPNESIENVRKLRNQMYERFHTNKKIIQAEEAGLFSQLSGYSTSLLNEVHKEQEKWELFYAELRNHVDIYIQGKATDANGQGAWSLTSKPGDVSVPVDKTTYWVYKNKDGKQQFFDIHGNGAYASNMDVALAKEEVARMQRIAILTEGLTDEWDDQYTAPQDRNSLALIHAKSIFYCDYINEALDNNKPENLEKKPMPKAGKLNASLKAKALSIAKSDDPSVIDVVITSNNWDVKPLERRIVYGYVIRKDDLGKRAFKRSWCQDYMGGGKYGSLRHHGVGTESYYVK